MFDYFRGKYSWLRLGKMYAERLKGKKKDSSVMRESKRKKKKKVKSDLINRAMRFFRFV